MTILILNLAKIILFDNNTIFCSNRWNRQKLWFFLPLEPITGTQNDHFFCEYRILNSFEKFFINHLHHQIGEFSTKLYF